MAGFAENCSTSSWVKFFTEGGIPHNVAANYAVTFVDNRITRNMLLDLNKEILHDMGISVMGDIIAILKHAKVVHAQMTREKVYQEESPVVPVSPARRSNPVGRILDHYTQRDSQSPTPQAPRAPAKRKCQEEIPVPKVRRVLPEHEGMYKITMPLGNTLKTRQLIQQKVVPQKPAVFSRLSATPSCPAGIKPIKAKATAKQPSASLASSVFNRLGPGKSQVSSTTVPDFEDDVELVSVHSPLEYQGILKSAPDVAKIPTVKRVSLLSPASSKSTVRKVPLSKRLGPKVTLGPMRASMLTTGMKPKRVLQAATISSCSEGILATGVTSSTQPTAVKSRLGGKPAPNRPPIPQRKLNLTKTVTGLGIRKAAGRIATSVETVTSTSLSRTVRNSPVQRTLTVSKPFPKGTLRNPGPLVSFSASPSVFNRLGPAYED